MLYLCMSIAGSIPVILCFLLWLFQRQSYNYQLGKRLLLIGMIFYLVPFQLVKHILPEWTIPILKKSSNMYAQQDFNKLVEIKSFMSPGESVWIPKWFFIILTVWLCFIISFSIYQIVKYRFDMKRLLAQSKKMVVDIDGNTIELLTNQYIHSPYTVGFLKQSIIVPNGSWEHPCFKMVYRHEEQHRKDHDSLMKLICIMIICIHFVNPVAILLMFLYSVTAEYVCDGKALEGYTDDKKKEYARLLVEASTEKEPLSMIWRNHLSCSGKLMRRRINYMLKKKGMVRRGFAAVVTVATVLASASTIFAYEPFVSTDADAIEVSDLGEFGAFTSEDSTNEDNIDDYDFSISDNIFIYEDGTQVPILSEESVFAICNHVMESGYYSVHSSNSSGGCTVYVYNAERCIRCGYIDVGSLYKTVTYTVCPH